MITKIFVRFHCLSNRCNRFIIGVIRDFWAFSEISVYYFFSLLINSSRDDSLSIDGLVKSLERPFSVIPAQAGIQSF